MEAAIADMDRLGMKPTYDSNRLAWIVTDEFGGNVTIGYDEPESRAIIARTSLLALTKRNRELERQIIATMKANGATEISSASPNL